MYFYILYLYNQQVSRIVLLHKITLHHSNTLKAWNDNILYKAGDLMCELEPVTCFCGSENLNLYDVHTAVNKVTDALIFS